MHCDFLGLSATYEDRWVNGSSAEKAKYQEQYSYLWNYVKNHSEYRCVDIGVSGTSGLGNFPSNANNVYDTMEWVLEGFRGDGT